MGFMSDVNRLMKVATKPDRKEIWLVIRVTAVGMIGLGFIGFIIQVAGNVIFNLNSSTSSSTTTSAAAAAVLHLIPILTHLI